MPLWLVIMALGAAGCGFLFLKAREVERAAPYKKLKRGSKTVKARAKRASGDIGIPPEAPYEILRAEQPVEMSMGASSKVAKQLEEIVKKEEF